MDRVQLLKRIESAWNELTSSYAGLSEDEMLEPSVAGGWSIKDIITHVTIWEGETLTHLPHILAGEKPPLYSVTYGGIDAFNAQRLEQAQRLSLAEVLRQRDETHQQLLTFLQGAPEDQLTRETRFRRRLRFDTYGHYREHTKMIRQWRTG